MRLISHFYFFCVLLVHIKIAYVEMTDTRTALISLMELQMDKCSELSMCTIKLPNNSSTGQSSSSCCKTCSCNIDCQTSGNCCPDFYVSTLIGHRVLNNISDLSERLQNMNSTELKRLQLLGDSSSHDTTSDTTSDLDCVNMEVGKTHLDLEASENTHYYRMIRGCPKFSNGDVFTESNCAVDVPLQHFGADHSQPDRVIPVTSLKTNATYKNIYCLRCNEKGNSRKELSLWKMILTCTWPPSSLFYDNPYTLFQRITSSRIYGCHLLMKPKDAVKHLVRRCRTVYVNRCPDDAEEGVFSICRAFHLPVIHADILNTPKIYKNIACYLCNIKTRFQKDCSNIKAGKKKFSMELNLLLNDQNILLRYNFSLDQNILNVSFGLDHSDNCQTGFLLDNETGTCRHVLCPRHFYPFDGRCIPAFIHMRNVSFTIMLEVIRFQTVEKDDMDEFYRIYLETVAQTLTGLFTKFTYGLWKWADDSDVLVVSLTGKSSTYVEMINNLARFLKQVIVLNLKIGTKTVMTLSSMLKNTKPPLLLFGKLYDTFQPGRRKTRLPTVREYVAFPDELYDIKISYSHFCYRTKLGPSGVYKDITGTYYVNHNATMLNPLDVQMLIDASIIVCLDDVDNTLRNVKTSYLIGGEIASIRARLINSNQAFEQPGNGDTNSDSVSGIVAGLPKELVIILVFVLVIGVVCFAKFIHYQRERRMRNVT